MLKNIVIVGGGTAGWLAAGILAAKFIHSKNNGPQITLVESPDVPTIGVGEGTWPSMRLTLKNIGLSETEFLKRCNASFKQGSKFVGWRDGSGSDIYYHPFTHPVSSNTGALVAAWKTHFPEATFDKVANLQCIVSERGFAPKQISTPEYSGLLNYGYHLDAGRFAELLREHCVGKLGVVHNLDHVESIEADSRGYLRALQLKKVGRLAGDFFIDCSGSNSLLIGQHYGVPLQSCGVYSPNDSALAAQVAYSHPESPIASATVATARSAGWIWDIGLSSRRGVGYVYSSAHMDDDRAEADLTRYLEASLSGDQLKDLSVRKLQFQAGYRREFWVNNCVAVGMSAGFIEPLEASALALVELSMNMIRDELPVTQELLPKLAERFNNLFTYRWQRIIEFLKLHYALSERRDTDYWRDTTASATVPDQLKEALELWRIRPPYSRDLVHSEEIFPAASYQYVLYGLQQNWQSADLFVSVEEQLQVRDLIVAERAKLERLCGALPSNRALLQKVIDYGFKKV